MTKSNLQYRKKIKFKLTKHIHKKLKEIYNSINQLIKIMIRINLDWIKTCILITKYLIKKKTLIKVKIKKMDFKDQIIKLLSLIQVIKIQVFLVKLLENNKVSLSCFLCPNMKKTKKIQHFKKNKLINKISSMKNKAYLNNIVQIK
jgi:hypothetical protein